MTKFEVGKKYCSNYCVAPYTCLATFVHNDMHRAVMESPVTQYPIIVIASDEWTEYREPVKIVRYASVYRNKDRGNVWVSTLLDSRQKAERMAPAFSDEEFLGVVELKGEV